MRRREFLLWGAAAALTPVHHVLAAEPLRIGLTPVILDDRVAFLRRWSVWLAKQLGQPVNFVQRAKYQDIMEQLDRRHVDAAWICGYPYVQHLDTLDLLAVPVYRGEPLYHAYIITQRKRREVQKLEDLEGRSFAFSDPLSNSGYLYTAYRLHQLRPANGRDRFFRRTFFTWGHRHVIEAVASGLADGGSVDGYVWDQLARLHPELTGQTRIVERSPAFGFPPIVSTHGSEPGQQRQLAEVLSQMHEDPEGRELLASLGLDGFVFRTPKLYAGIALMASTVGDEGFAG
ncbi:MAG: ABC transporter substrate-binding protein [Gammaproteobacteria bacterium]|nr:MAG: ABC transporter substrate-binding protein [Gammaproteobacteria bacterium]